MGRYKTVGKFAQDILPDAKKKIDHFNPPSEVLYIRDYGVDSLERYDVLIHVPGIIYTLNINDVCTTCHHDIPKDTQDMINYMKYTDQGTLIPWKQLSADIQKAILVDIAYKNILEVG